MRVVSTILLVVRSFGWEALPTFLHIYWTTGAYTTDLDYFLGVYSSTFFIKSGLQSICPYSGPDDSV